MDNLAHTLTGAALGAAGLNRRTSLAMPTLLIGANLPDIDVLAMLVGHGLSFRRGWTHGVLALLLLPIVLALAMLAWDRWVRRRRGRRTMSPAAVPRQILLLSFVAVLSHPLLDWLNNYGMRWLMPFDGTWYYGDALFIVDPWLWLILLVGVVLARRERGAWAGIAALAVAGVYAGAMIVTAAIGRVLVDASLREAGTRAESVMVGPVPIDPSRRQVIGFHGDFYRTGTLVFLPRPQVTFDTRVVAANLDDPAAIRASSEPEVERFLRWARYPFFMIHDLGDRQGIMVDDLRYSDGRVPSWAAVYLELPHPP